MPKYREVLFLKTNIDFQELCNPGYSFKFRQNMDYYSWRFEDSQHDTHLILIFTTDNQEYCAVAREVKIILDYDHTIIPNEILCMIYQLIKDGLIEKRVVEIKHDIY